MGSLGHMVGGKGWGGGGVRTIKSHGRMLNSLGHVIGVGTIKSHGRMLGLLGHVIGIETIRSNG